MRLLVTGAAGMLGTDVVAAARAAGHDVQALARGELDVADSSAVSAAVGRLEPHAVINCAAWTDVDGAERDPQGALVINGAGAGNVARAAAAAGAHLVHVSTDYVFDGRASRPYVESDPPAPEPASAYGASKLEGERRVRGAGGSHLIVRTAWLFGLAGTNFVDTMLRLAGEGRDELSVVDDQRGSPTWTGHLGAALVEMAQRRLTGTLHAAADGDCTWNELAREVFALAGLDVRVAAMSSEQLARPAPRPAYSVLGSERPDAPRLPAWQAGVRAHLAARGVLTADPAQGVAG